ncbi:MAG: hypothetical protein ACI9F2_000851 [Lysobacterales bacterium]|jgi:hypothetical protein
MRLRTLSKIICLAIGALFVLMPSQVIAAEGKPQVEVYANGKFYRSFEQYRDERLKQQIIDTLGYAERVAFDQYLRENTEHLSMNEHAAVSDAEFRTLLRAFRSNYRGTPLAHEGNKNNDDIVVSKVDPLDEMDEMLADLKRSNNKASTITINPAKMKTIIIKPSSDSSRY